MSLAPDLQIHDLGALTEVSFASPDPLLPIPALDSLTGLLNGRTYARDSIHLSHRTAVVTNTTGKFAVRMRVRNLTSTGQIVGQFLNGGSLPNHKFEYSLQSLSSGRIQMRVWEKDQPLVNIESFTKDISNIPKSADGSLEIVVVCDVITGSFIKIYVQGDDVENTVGYQTNSVGTITTFEGGTVIDEFSVGNFASGSTIFSGIGGDVFHIDIWDGQFPTDQDIADDFAASELLIFSNPITTAQTSKLDLWSFNSPELTAFNTLTETFSLGVFLGAVGNGDQTLSEQLINAINDWCVTEPALRRVGTLTEPFRLGDVLAEIGGPPPRTSVLTAFQIARLNEWEDYDPSLDRIDTLTDPFSFGDFLNNLLTR